MEEIRQKVQILQLYSQKYQALRASVAAITLARQISLNQRFQLAIIVN